MFLTLSEIGKLYNISAIQAGKILYTLGVRDPNHPIKKGFPYEQYIEHNIAHPKLGSDKEVKYFTYDIRTIKNEFEALIQDKTTKKTEDESNFVLNKLSMIEVLSKEINNPDLEEKLKQHIKDIKYHIHQSDLNTDMPLNEKATRVYEQLQTYRRHKSKIENISAFLVFTNALLHHLSYQQPQTLKELELIKGMGDKKIRNYGNEILHIIQGV